MVALEIAGGLAFAALAGVTVAMAIVGCLGVLGALRFERCEECGRLPTWPRGNAVRECVGCRFRTLRSRLRRAFAGIAHERSD